MGFTQLRQFRDVSNFNVGLYMQQAGFTLDETLSIAGGFANPHYSREMRDQSQTVDIVHNYANGLFDEVFCNEISSPGVWWPGPISGGPMNYSG